MTRLHGAKDFWLAGLRAEGPVLRAAATAAGAQTAVPTCPGWTIDHLIRHVAGCYRWVGQHVTRGEVSRPPEERSDQPPEDASGDPIEWFDAEFVALLRLLDGLDPELPAWNWAPQTKKAAFWHRRMAHETAVHRWDAQMAAGQAEPVEAKLAADGVSEVLDTWLPAGRRRAPAGVHGVIHLVATDASEEWFVRLRGAGVALLDTGTLLDTDDPHPRAHAAGTASDLLLALYGRVPFEVLTVAGQAGLLEALRTG
ncbi:maleylpyruvate isomerase family mycothiol-dependent enzyme [Rhizomonospora bruguierae]|uniref:maleylpyruvate isomerase family mycothiol-dependent enzyme n=1 Tax=Rhizomonospora bruguierae TaxID=1581705 RepID=UPI001BCD7FCA|nr:maleylpyruvate isomerase family mycothiol-dependent enzyme [Micromonospora sp. NBRC 107566]